MDGVTAALPAGDGAVSGARATRWCSPPTASDDTQTLRAGDEVIATAGELYDGQGHSITDRHPDQRIRKEEGLLCLSAENIAGRSAAEIDEAARGGGRTGADITLVGASKMNDAAACQEAIAAGIDALGENRVQEMTGQAGAERLRRRAAALHRPSAAQQGEAGGGQGGAHPVRRLPGPAGGGREGRRRSWASVQDILLEVNIGGEEAKSGFAPEAVDAAARHAARELPHVRVRGLMTIPPVGRDRARKICAYFEKVQALYVDINREIVSIMN